MTPALTLQTRPGFRPMYSHETTSKAGVHVHYRCPNTGWRGVFLVRARPRRPHQAGQR